MEQGRAQEHACVKDGHRGDECEECYVGYYEHSKNKTYTDCRSKYTAIGNIFYVKEDKCSFFNGFIS